ncbi:hypothetical protein [Paraburkholderia heleia]|uniref:hypothetical protein n=1 Tax=Paraburkholderia heleia TaxID=634127 RepID=UPI0031E03E54
MWTIAPVMAPLHEGFIAKYPSLRLMFNLNPIRPLEIYPCNLEIANAAGLIWRQTYIERNGESCGKRWMVIEKNGYRLARSGPDERVQNQPCWKVRSWPLRLRRRGQWSGIKGDVLLSSQGWKMVHPST